MLSLAGRIQVCSHWLAGYKYALIGRQDTSMLSLDGRIQVCSHWLRGQLFPVSHLLIENTVSSFWLAEFTESSYWLIGRGVLDSMTEPVN
jgi:hypothetical protein